MKIYLNTLFLHSLFKSDCRVLSGKSCKHYGTHIKPTALEFMHKTLYILIISDTKITSNLVFLDMCSIYYDHYLCPVSNLHKHTKLGIRLKSRKHARCMIIIK